MDSEQLIVRRARPMDRGGPKALSGAYVVDPDAPSVSEVVEALRMALDSPSEAMVYINDDLVCVRDHVDWLIARLEGSQNG